MAASLLERTIWRAPSPCQTAARALSAAAAAAPSRRGPSRCGGGPDAGPSEAPAALVAEPLGSSLDLAVAGGTEHHGSSFERLSGAAGTGGPGPVAAACAPRDTPDAAPGTPAGASGRGGPPWRRSV